MQDVSARYFASHDSNYGTVMDADPSVLRRLLVSCLDHQLHSTRADPTARDEDLFAIASLHLAHTHSSTLPSPSNAPVTVSATPTSPLVSFPLLQQLNADHITDEQMNKGHYNIPKSAQDMISYELPIQNGVRWLLDLQLCSLSNGATANEGSDPRGIWLRQSAATAIAQIVGISMFDNEENVQMLQGMPVITDEVHDPLGLGVNIGYSSGSRTPKYSWFDYLVTIRPRGFVHVLLRLNARQDQIIRLVR
jgi:hypothetical protein